MIHIITNLYQSEMNGIKTSIKHFQKNFGNFTAAKKSMEQNTDDTDETRRLTP